MRVPCRVLIVDDSASYRNQIKLALEGQAGIEVSGMASDGLVALGLLGKESYDLMVMDLEMPHMDGISLLAEIKKAKISLKTIVFSSSSTRGARITLEALSLGAVDFALKPISTAEGKKAFELIRESLIPKIRELFPLKSTVASITPKADVTPTNWHFFNPSVVTIASSTGGPRALEEMFSLIHGPLDCPILITQHMPPIFTASLAESIQKKSGITCREAIDGEVISNNIIYIAPGNFHMSLYKEDFKIKIKLDQRPLRNSIRPCADFLFETAAEIFGRNTLGIVLTGMGSDGKDGALAIKSKKGAIITQEESSCVVYGMPRAVHVLGLSDKVGTPNEIAQFLDILVKRRKAS